MLDGFLREGQISFHYQVYRTPVDGCNSFSLAEENNRPATTDNIYYIMHN